MRSFRMLAFGAALALAGCAGGLAGLGSTTPAQAITVGAAEQLYTTAAHAEVVWLQNGHPTKAQAAIAKSLEGAVYADVVAGRTAVANNDSAAIAVALKLFNQALPAFQDAISPGGANVAN